MLFSCYHDTLDEVLRRRIFIELAIFYIIHTYYTTIITSFDRDFMEVRPTIIGILNKYTTKYLYLYARLILPFYMEKQSSGKVGTKMPDFEQKHIHIKCSSKHILHIFIQNKAARLLIIYISNIYTLLYQVAP